MFFFKIPWAAPFFKGFPFAGVGFPFAGVGFPFAEVGCLFPEVGFPFAGVDFITFFITFIGFPMAAKAKRLNKKKLESKTAAMKCLVLGVHVLFGLDFNLVLIHWHVEIRKK